jgi:CubicO group peptidase (beta-lactamase class C family)
MAVSFKTKLKNCGTTILLSFFTSFAFCQQKTTYSKATDQKIKEVENNLISWVKLDSSANWNIYDRMKDMHINGACIAVIKDYKIEWIKAYGWADTLEKRRVTTETLFQSASIGKSINGFAFMKLAQDKKINLYADINSYLKSWKFLYDTTAHGKKINLAEILSHTAGLTVHGFDGYKWNDPIPALIQILDGKKPANNAPVRSKLEPEQKFEYSGGGYEISELLLEDVTRNSYENFMRKTIFDPLKMSSCFYTTIPPKNLEKRLATAYRLDGQPVGCKYHLYPEKACGAGLWTTATDLARFVIEVQLSLAGKSNKVINKKMTELMLTPYLKSSKYGFGFFIEKKGSDYYFQHSGLNEGFSSQYYGSFKDGNGIVVLANSDNTNFMGEVVNSVATVYGWKNFYDFASKKLFKPTNAITDKYVGRYKFENAETGPVILKENGTLYLKDPNSPDKWKIYFTSEKDFFMLEARWANQQFFTDENGNVKGFYILGDNYKATVNKDK